jgi:hypothetical protein
VAGNQSAHRELVPALLAIAGLVLALVLAETVGGAVDGARATAGGSLSSMCPDGSPTVQDAVEPVTPREAEEAAPPAAIAPALRSFDHRSLTPLRPSLKRARGGGVFEITGSRATGSLVGAPAGGVELDSVLCMVSMQTTSAETPARIVGEDSALRANSAPGTDTIVRPTARGVAVVQSRRGADAPTSFTWRLGLPSGKRLLSLHNGDVAIADPGETGRRAVGVVRASSAVGSQFDSPPAQLEASGDDTLTASAPQDAEAVVVTVTAKRAKKKKKKKPPDPVPSYPLIGVEANLSTEAANAACAFAQTQPEGRRLMLFNLGQAHFEGGEFGAGRRPFYSNDEVLNALIAAANRYRAADCHLPRTKATIAYGVTNFRLSETGTTIGEEFAPMSTQLAAEAGAEQLEVARTLRQSVNAKDHTAVAGDIEPGWDLSPAGAEVGKALVSGANTGQLTYFNFGTAGHCPPYVGTDPGCGSWRWNDLGDISQKRGAVALPQIYHAYQAKQWNTVRKRWNRRKVNKPQRCSDSPSAKCYTFAGATSEPEECGSDFTARKSWKLLRDAVPEGTIGEELIYYNPARLNC